MVNGFWELCRTKPKLNQAKMLDSNKAPQRQSEEEEQ